MFKLMLTFKRKKGLTRQQFMDYYENNHVVLAHNIMPAMELYRRNYIINDHPFFASVGDNRGTGAGIEPPFDVVTECVYASQAEAEAQMKALFDGGGASKQIFEDEANFVEPGSISFYVVESHQSALPWNAVGNTTFRR